MNMDSLSILGPVKLGLFQLWPSFLVTKIAMGQSRGKMTFFDSPRRRTANVKGWLTEIPGMIFLGFPTHGDTMGYPRNGCDFLLGKSHE
jgi:hypothetical protein